MKKTLMFIAFLLLVLVSYGQKNTKFYGGLYLSDQSIVVRPYVYYNFYPNNSDYIKINSVIGVGVNYYNKLNITIGQDWLINDKFLISPGISFFGYKEIYQNYLPELRTGLKFKKNMVIATTYWNYRDVELEIGQIGKQPKLKFTIGYFRSF